LPSVAQHLLADTRGVSLDSRAQYSLMFVGIF